MKLEQATLIARQVKAQLQPLRDRSAWIRRAVLRERVGFPGAGKANTMIDKTTPAKFVSFGNGGDTVHFGKVPAYTRPDGTVQYSGNCESQGYGTPERPHAADPATHNIPDGTPVLDIRTAVESSEGFAWVFKGPMLDVDLPRGDITRMNAPSPEFAGALAETNDTFALLLAQQAVNNATTPKEPGPLDYGDLDTYIAGWVKRGARVGHYEAGRIVWHDTTTYIDQILNAK